MILLLDQTSTENGFKNHIIPSLINALQNCVPQTVTFRGDDHPQYCFLVLFFEEKLNLKFPCLSDDRIFVHQENKTGNLFSSTVFFLVIMKTCPSDRVFC